MLYLIECNSCIAGAVGFYSPAIKMMSRDKFIGWTDDERESLLHHVVRMNPFYLRKDVDADIVASKIIQEIPLQLKDDFLKIYGIKVEIIETYNISNSYEKYFINEMWQFLETKHENPNTSNLSESTHIDSSSFLYLYDVNKIWEKLNLSNVGQSPLPLESYINLENWINTELSDIDFGDKRRYTTFIELLKLKIESPTISISEIINKNSAFSQRVKRLLRSCDDLFKKNQNYLESLYNGGLEQYTRRIRNLNVAVHVTDGVRLNYANKIKCEGLGIIGSNNSDNVTLGLHGHYTLSLDLKGTAYGILRMDLNAYPKRKKGEKVNRKDRKSQLWFRHAEAVNNLAKKTPDTVHFYTADRESDILELFVRLDLNPNVFFMCRAVHNRICTDKEKVFDKLSETKPLGTLEVVVERKSERKDAPERPKRVAKLTIYSTSVEIKLPRRLRKIYGQSTIKLYYIRAIEENVSIADPIDWKLVTNRPVYTIEDALYCIRIYKLRWKIEECNRVIKTTCGIEDLHNHSANKLRVLSKIIFTVSWWISMITSLSRVDKEIPADKVCEESKLLSANLYAEYNNIPQISSFSQYVNTLARMGGYRNRSGDLPPGSEIIARGITELGRSIANIFMLVKKAMGDDGEIINKFAKAMNLLLPQNTS